MDTNIKVWLKRRQGLKRFLNAQNYPFEDNDTFYDCARTELTNGMKETHWMWFVFPQGKGLGRSENSKIYALSKREAKKYAKHEILGARLYDCTRAVKWQLEAGMTVEEIFGPIDALKFHSCMKLFAEVTGDALFRKTQHLTYIGRIM